MSISNLSCDCGSWHLYRNGGRAATREETGPFTAEQAAAGRAIYQSTCSTCHLPDMKGTFEAPPLSSANFIEHLAQPPDERPLHSHPQYDARSAIPARSSDQDAANLVAFILQANGAIAGTQAMTPQTIVPIGAVANGGAATPAAMQGGEEDATPRAAAAPRNGPLGVTVAGEVKNYVPVTDEMLRNQDPGDWLMARATIRAGATAR